MKLYRVAFKIDVILFLVLLICLEIFLYQITICPNILIKKFALNFIQKILNKNKEQLN